MENKMTIQVLGSGCPTCKNLYELVKKVVGELKIDTEVEYITDVTKMIEMGIMSSPAMVVNGKVVLTGGRHDAKEIKEVLTSNSAHSAESNKSGCSCGGKC